ncbi:cobalamin-dependent protein [Metallumcola ferriviriculae]|uniref:Cobalamin-dependent protein n=1 Tax=Metallumcola ferriviriculae TaxID=3039180 RepID=A0AAU0UQS5_9FIRM|nr:cobalamin-dependent protein [Desulfitibacteraceae bacterium MK1]
MAVELSRVRPYGDTLDDGAVQLSFTLPVPTGEEARQAALMMAAQMGLKNARVVWMDRIGENFTYIILYAQSPHWVDYTAIQVVKPDYQLMQSSEINTFIKKNLGRKITVLGACIESDAHTVGIDAIMNMKGYDMHKGLESYPEINAINLGAQVPAEELVARAVQEQADALLISQVVTQRDIHVKNLTRLIELLEAEELRDELVVIVGGPHITPELAKELGYDAGFSTGTYPEDVASFLVQLMAGSVKQQ